MENSKVKNKALNQESKQNHTGSICLLSVMGIFSLMFYSLYRSSGTRFEQVFIAILFVFGVCPIILACTVTFLTAKVNSIKTNKSDVILDKIEPKGKDAKSKKTGKTPTTEGYTETRDLFKFASQKGRLSMENYFEIKYFIKARLSDNYKPYEDVQWKNDSHCIYSMLKSSKLTTEDYRAICELIHDVMGTEECIKETEVNMEVQ